MPHSLFLGSALATQDRISFRAPQDTGTISRNDTNDSLASQRSEKFSHLRQFFEKSKRSILAVFLKPPPSPYSSTATSYSDRQNNSFEFVHAHLYHGMFDIVGSLLGFAVMINSL